MRKTVYNYISANGPVSVSQVASDCNINGTEVLNSIEYLRANGFVKQCAPLPLEINVKGSCFYQVTSKEYRGE